MRHGVIAATAKDGNQIATAGTHPFSSWEELRLAPKERYQGLMRDYQQLTRELVIFGCHVHLSLRDREVAIQVSNRSRVWLATILALTSNSPFWLGADAGYGSFCTELWIRQGTGATWQRQIYQRAGRLEDVVDFLVRETARGVKAADQR